MTHFPSLARQAIPVTLPGGMILPSGMVSTKDCPCFVIKSFVWDLPVMKHTFGLLTVCYLREQFEERALSTGKRGGKDQARTVADLNLFLR